MEIYIKGTNSFHVLSLSFEKRAELSIGISLTKVGKKSIIEQLRIDFQLS
ncbi:hypothetical protein STRDD10_00159 [Streptococcus sp. DD10]|nr:hypothetical protein STRDD10_00159 [Streptococcus sp. DD10]